jgi:hypothetical protein
VPPIGLGQQLDAINAWLDANCGAGNWAMTPAGIRGVVNDALAIYFADTALASTVVARWCIGYWPDTSHGSLGLRDDEPAKQTPGCHRTEPRHQGAIREIYMSVGAAFSETEGGPGVGTLTHKFCG